MFFEEESENLMNALLSIKAHQEGMLAKPNLQKHEEKSTR